MRTCAICGERDASDVTDWDGREVAACARCLSPANAPSDKEMLALCYTGRGRGRPPVRRLEIIEALSRQTMTTSQLYAELGCDSHKKQHTTLKALGDLVKNGTVRVIIRERVRFYELVQRRAA